MTPDAPIPVRKKAREALSASSAILALATASYDLPLGSAVLVLELANTQAKDVLVTKQTVRTMAKLSKCTTQCFDQPQGKSDLQTDSSIDSRQSILRRNCRICLEVFCLFPQSGL